MPAVSQNQQKFMGAELARKRAGEPTQTDMSETQLQEFAATPRKDLPKKKAKPSSKSQDRIKIARHVMKSVRAKM